MNGKVANSNPQDYQYIDTLRTIGLDNGFVFNLIQWHSSFTEKTFYEIRLGYLRKENETPVITLYRCVSPVKVKNYWDTLIDNASDLYLFNKEGD